MTQDDVTGYVDQAQQGDREATAALFDRFYDGVYRYAYVRLGSVSDAEEAAQETFTQMVRSIKRFRWRGSTFEAWLFRIARNVVADEHRRRARRPEDLRDQIQDHGAGEPSAEEHAVSRDESRRLRAILSTLPEEQRRVLELRFAAGLSSEDTAQVLGKSAGAVRIQQLRALQAMRRRLEVTL